MIFAVTKAGLATKTELETTQNFDDLMKMYGYICMEKTIESEISKVLMPKVDK